MLFVVRVIFIMTVLALPAQAISPDDNYTLHCMGCHLADGSETPGHIPAIRSAARFLAAPGGREFLIRVPGVANSPINNKELAELLNWMLHEFSSEDEMKDFQAYTTEEVAMHRVNVLTEVEKVRESLLNTIASTK
jgi:hypothetical protein